MAVLKKFLQNTRGNIAAMFTVSLFPILATVGSAVDYSMYVNERSKVAHAVDAAILAASSSVNSVEEMSDLPLVNEKVKRQFGLFLDANLSEFKHLDYNFDGINYDPATRRVEAKVSFNYDTHFMGIFGRKEIKQTITAATRLQAEESGALSMFLVLDKSGSMGWQNKMDALKAAIAGMTTMFAEMDPDKKYVRMGAVAYDSQTKKQTNLTWGSDAVLSYANSLVAWGGTNSANAVKVARNKLRANKETKEHEAKNGQEPARVLVFMTDGANNRTQDDKRTKNFCDSAKKSNIEIYSVAFKAPIRGEELLKYCASSVISHYFEAEDAEQLIDAFRQIATSAASELVLVK